MTATSHGASFPAFLSDFPRFSPALVVPGMRQPQTGRNQQRSGRRLYEEREGYGGGQAGIQHDQNGQTGKHLSG